VHVHVYLRVCCVVLCYAVLCCVAFSRTLLGCFAALDDVAGFAIVLLLRLLLGGVQREQFLEARPPRDAGTILGKDVVPPFQEPVGGWYLVDLPDPSQSHLVVGHLKDRNPLVDASVVFDGVNGGHAFGIINATVAGIGRVERVVVVFQVRELEFSVVGTVEPNVARHQPIHFKLADVAFGIVQDIDFFRKQPFAVPVPVAAGGTGFRGSR
jgi:hypothetical protein